MAFPIIVLTPPGGQSFIDHAYNGVYLKNGNMKQIETGYGLSFEFVLVYGLSYAITLLSQCHLLLGYQL